MIKDTTRAHKIITKNFYMVRRIPKSQNRKGSKIIKGPIIIQNFISSQILFNKNIVKFLGCYN